MEHPAENGASGLAAGTPKLHALSSPGSVTGATALATIAP
jgi:hypothetical protein